MLPCEEEKRDGAENLNAIADEDDLPSVEAVGNVAGGEDKEESGQKERQAGVAKVDGAVRDEVNLPGDGERLGFGSNDDHDARKLVASEIAGAEGGGAGSARR